MRYYGEDKISEDKSQCIVRVSPMGGQMYQALVGSYQCSRKRGHGPNGEFCKQHARLMADERYYVSVPKDKP